MYRRIASGVVSLLNTTPTKCRIMTQLDAWHPCNAFQALVLVVSQLYLAGRAVSLQFWCF